ncbi:SMP-30/gluconolactonase/LRE family protein [Pedococcus sp. 5OH_020]|uniref:SMP-30/gluconolactonase/LRE family protein n=1 Tax=Pedococcus sp. 5OH_020 TaxID=2989814 RepID=UPI0022E9CE63|nr:SMP-30/gluconolactonase/LRE family protein [Pedococcus sp. 5OH_020]
MAFTAGARPASAGRYILGEGPVWDPVRRRLLWVDIVAGALFEGTLADGLVHVTDRLVFPGTVGAVAVGDNGSLLVAAQETLVVVHPNGTRTDGARVVPAGRRARLNDGGTDPDGRFLVGTLSLDGPSRGETLVRLEHDGSIAVLDDDLTLSNGLAWTTDGKRMYSVDTLRQVVHARNYDPPTGATGAREAFLMITDGWPDGVAIDSEDHLWVAVWGVGVVRRYTPEGTLVDEIHVPAPHTSSLAFAGDDLRTLVITTATHELEPAQLAQYPDSGRLFTVRVPIPGTPCSLWATKAPAA